jgi:hypothetical protein
MTDAVPEDRLAQLRLMQDEVNAQQASYDQRLQGMDTRAGLLVAAAGIAASLAGVRIGNGWMIFAIATLLGSAVVGVIALWPGHAKSLSREGIRNEVYGRTEAGALLWLFDMKDVILTDNEARIVRKARLFQVGAILFAISVVFVFLAATTLQVKIGGPRHE